ncbi:MAG: hypothetical protein P4M11_15005 [Candidatus Pacebacteria bacterium]|nr:hypothetical protein [Candidatus Paceibacterota bacterium]
MNQYQAARLPREHQLHQRDVAYHREHKPAERPQVGLAGIRPAFDAILAPDDSALNGHESLTNYHCIPHTEEGYTTERVEEVQLLRIPAVDVIHDLEREGAATEEIYVGEEESAVELRRGESTAK